jgi:Cytochrome b(C-terminal)/b6/petD
MFVIQFIKNAIDFLSAPQYLVTGALIGLILMIHWAKPWSPKGGLVLLALVAGGIGLSYLDPNFNKVATLPDNVPIVGMIFLVGFFFWFAMSQAYENDRRIGQGRPPIEGEDSGQKVFSWPDLVYVELICLVVVMAVMIVWSIALKAPLEEPANPTDSPNPAKAPWYFLGLQEMLVYFDPWLAGVVLPSLIIVGLMAIPYIDTNPKGNGYFTFKERRFEITIFLVGFLVLWVVLIVLGTFLRGPNWNFFGPYEFWDINKLVPLNNINLSEIIWIKIFKRAQLLAVPRDLRPRARGLLHRRAAARALSHPVPEVLREDGHAAVHDRRIPRPDDDVPPDQDVPALDLQPQVHRRDPRVRVQHLDEPDPCPASRPPNRSIIITTSRG